MENKSISLDDLIKEKEDTTKSSNTSTRREVSIEEIKPFTKEEDPQKKFEDEHYALMDNAIERTKKDLEENVLEPFKQKCIEIAEREEFESENATTMSNIVSGEIELDIKDKPSNPNNVDNIIRSDAQHIDVSNPEIKSDAQALEIDEKDFADFENDINDSPVDIEESNHEEEELSEEEQKELLDNLRKQVTEAIQPNTIDISAFTIASNNMSIGTSMSRISNKFSSSHSIPLYNTGRMISFTPPSGSDIVAMSSESYNSRLETLKKTYSVMYSHDASINRKQVSFTKWLKSIDAGDLLQLYFGLYKAAFEGSNYIGYKCDECNNFFMVKRDINDMYSFAADATDEQKARMKAIEEHGEVEDNIKSREEMYVLSPNYALLLHPRTLYNTLEIEYLDNRFREKYSSILQPMQYIGKIYFIDKEKNKLIPIDLKPDPDSIVKTIKNKCLVIYKMISSITPDEYAMFIGKLTNYNIKEIEASNLIEYHVPEQVCTEMKVDKKTNVSKECKHVIPKEIMSPYQMLFTRHQLVMQSTLRVD